MARVKQEYQQSLTEFSASHREEVRIILIGRVQPLNIINSPGNEADDKQNKLENCWTDGFCPRESLHCQREPRLENRKIHTIYNLGQEMASFRHF